MAEEDYYEVLGVPRSATETEINKAYRQLARKFHPDAHVDKDEREQARAKQQFQKVQQAYGVLSDPKKRQMYDQMGPGFENMSGNPFGGAGGGPGGIDLGQIFGGGSHGGGGGFEDILRQMGGGGGMGGQPQRPTRGQDVEQEITVPFATSVLGGKHQISLQRRNGSVDKIDVKIPAGIESGKKIRVRGQGQSGGGGGHGPRGDLMIVVKVAPHPNYTRKGLNLHVTVAISLIEAVEGAKIDLPTPHGKVAVTVPAGSSSGRSLRLKGMGIKGADRSGDLIVILQIALPDEVSDEDLETIKQLSESWGDSDVRSELTW